MDSGHILAYLVGESEGRRQGKADSESKSNEYSSDPTAFFIGVGVAGALIECGLFIFLTYAYVSFGGRFGLGLNPLYGIVAAVVVTALYLAWHGGRSMALLAGLILTPAWSIAAYILANTPTNTYRTFPDICSSIGTCEARLASFQHPGYGWAIFALVASIILRAMLVWYLSAHQDRPFLSRLLLWLTRLTIAVAVAGLALWAWTKIK